MNRENNTLTLNWLNLTEITYYLVMLLDINDAIITAVKTTQNSYQFNDLSLEQIVTIVVIGIEEKSIVTLKHCHCKINYHSNTNLNMKIVHMDINCGCRSKSQLLAYA